MLACSRHANKASPAGRDDMAWPAPGRREADGKRAIQPLACPGTAATEGRAHAELRWEDRQPKLLTDRNLVRLT